MCHNFSTFKKYIKFNIQIDSLIKRSDKLICVGEIHIGRLCNINNW